MKHIKPFEHFLYEAQRDKPVDHVEDIEIKDKSNKKVEKDAQDYVADMVDYCPRCGEHVDDCECKSIDPWSTQNYHRVPKGKTEN
jgi:hypothetical protein